MRIGGYEVLGELGRGGMGTVYRVRAPGGGEAALKLLRGTDAATFARFERERRLLASLGEESGFVALLEAGATTEGAWLLMAFVPGGTLRQRLEPGPLGVEDTVTLGMELAAALGRAHERGIVHRDVKPENVLFTATGRALVADLGLAKHFDRSGPGGSQSLSLSAWGGLKGTAGYMAPEQCVDASTVGPAADVFALGAVLYECLSGMPAFPCESIVEMVAKASSGTLAPIGREGIPAGLEAIVRRALAPDPSERFADGAALARALGARDGKPAARRGARRLGTPLALGAAVGVGVLLAGIVAFGRATPRHEAPAPSAGAPSSSRPPRSDPRAAGALAAMARGVERTKKGDWDGAVDDCTRAIELDPALSSAWENRGFARSKRGDRDGALADCSRAIELAGDSASPWATRCSVRCGALDWDGALADASKAIELDPGLARAWADRALARANKKDWDGSLADSSRAIELDSKLARGWTNRAAVRFSVKDWDGAIADGSRAIELDPGSAPAWFARGMARLGKRDLAGTADLERYIELEPEGVNAQTARRLIDKARGR